MTSDNLFISSENIDSGRRQSLRWVENAGHIGINQLSANSQFLSLSLSNLKFRLLFMGISLGLLLLLGKSFYLQVIQAEQYAALAEANRSRINYLKAPRGIFYDRNQQVLVQNISGFSLLISPKDLPTDVQSRQDLLTQMAELAEMPVEDIQSQIDDTKYYFQPILIKTGIDYETAMALKIMSADWPGISLEADSWRRYLTDQGLAHVFGYVGKINAEEYAGGQSDYLLTDSIGKTGLEKQYESDLRGQHGQKKIEVDALGREKKVIAIEPFVAGNDLVLTLDADLHRQIYTILDEELKREKAAVVIASDPQTGQILAMVNYPGYDNNLFSTGISQTDYSSLLDDELKPLFNRAVSGEYPSGSTIKPIMAAAALQEGIVDQHTSFLSQGGLWIHDLWFFPDWLAGGHGSTNVIRAIAQSVNTYFYYIGGGYGEFEGLGVDRIARYLDLFGLGRVSGLDLPGEKPGLIPTPEWKQEVKDEMWYIGDTYHLAIGQGDLLVTPLQVNNYIAAIANGGTLYQPQLVKEIIEPDNRRQVILKQVMNQDFIDSDKIEIVRRGMRETVLSGSGVALSGLSVPVAGKTGTAQWHYEKENHAWFVAFAPYTEPSFCLTVLIEEGGEGSKIAVLIAKQILSYWFEG